MMSFGLGTLKMNKKRPTLTTITSTASTIGFLNSNNDEMCNILKIIVMMSFGLGALKMNKKQPTLTTITSTASKIRFLIDKMCTNIQIHTCIN